MELSPRSAKRQQDALRTQRKKAERELLYETGVLIKMKGGRKRLYSPDTAKRVAKQQRRESQLRRMEQIRDAKRLLSERGNAIEPSSSNLNPPSSGSPHSAKVP